MQSSSSFDLKVPNIVIVMVFLHFSTPECKGRFELNKEFLKLINPVLDIISLL